MKSFFYNGKYYLVPKKFETFERFYDFLSKKLRRGRKVTLLVDSFCEDWCMAPYFTYECMTKQKICVTNVDAVFPATIEVMTQAEYNLRLREVVTKTCPGCAVYTPITEDDESLVGHHQEINLEGKCFFKKETDEAHYQLCHSLEGFLYNFETKRARLEELIDQGNTSLASEALMFLLEPKLGFKPFSINLFKRKGVYYCCFPCYLDLNLALIYRYLCQVLNKRGEKLHITQGWKFLSYLPKGALGNNVTTPPLKFIFNNNTLQKIDIVVPDFERAHESYLSLCNTFGEDRFLTAYSQLWIKFETKSYGIDIPVQNVEKDVSAILKKFYSGEEPSLPSVKDFSISNAKGEIIRRARTLSPIFFVASDNEKDLFSDQVKKDLRTDLLIEYGINIGKMSVNANGFKLDKALTQTFSSLVDNDKNMLFAKETSSTNFILYFLIGDKNSFLCEAEKYKPVFDKFPTEIKVF